MGVVKFGKSRKCNYSLWNAINGMEFVDRLWNSSHAGPVGLIARRNSLYSTGISADSDRPSLYVLLVRENGAFVP